MMRNPPRPLPAEPEGQIPEDDYSTFDAWEGDFEDDEIEPDHVSAPSRDATMSFSAKGHVPLPPKITASSASRQLPLPPSNDDSPPLIIPRGAGGALPPIPKQPTAKAFNHPPPRKYQPPSPDDPSEDYLEPSRNSDPLEEDDYLEPQIKEEEDYLEPDMIEEENYAPIEDEYDEAEEVSCPPIRAAKHQFRELPPQPPRSPMNPHHMEEYEEPSQLDYEDADTIQPDRNKQQFRALPPQPPRQSADPSYEEEYETTDDNTYEDTNKMNNQRSRMPDPQRQGNTEDDFDDDSDDEDCSETYAEPDEMSNPLPRRGPVPPLPSQRVEQSNQDGGTSNKKFQQLKLVGDETLRQKRGGLRKVIPEYSSSHNNNQQNNIDDDDDGDESGGIGGIKNILKKLAKQSSLFRGSPKMGSSEPKTKTLPARSLPQPPPTSRPLPNMSSNDSSRSSASSDNSSGSGTFVPPRRVVAPLPPAPAQTPASPIKQYNRRVEDEMWYFDIERNEVQDKLESSPGMFLVRPSKLGGPRSPYTLCVFHGTRIYNLNIRLREDASYALGTPHANEKTFKNVAEMINYHHNNPITLAGQDRSTVLLTESPIRDDIYDQTM